MSQPCNLEDLNKLIDQAEREGKWLESYYQGISFSPHELRREVNQGNFRWGVTNWRLIDPKDLLRDEEREVRAIRSHNEKIRYRMIAK